MTALQTRATRCVLKLTHAGSSPYIDFIYRIEAVIGRKPRRLQVDLVGPAALPPDAALLLRSVLVKRSEATHLVTNARSSLLGASTLIWLLGDTRLIREDARLFFRSSSGSGSSPDTGSSSREHKWLDAADEEALAEADYERVLELINEFLPVRELAGQPVEISVLKQFGLIDNHRIDERLALAFAEPAGDTVVKPTRSQEAPPPRRRSGRT